MFELSDCEKRKNFLRKLIREVVKKCAVCGRGWREIQSMRKYDRLKGPKSPIELDHLIPLSRGGPDIPANTIPMCAPCNRNKGAELVADWNPCLADPDNATEADLNTPYKKQSKYSPWLQKCPYFFTSWLGAIRHADAIGAIRDPWACPSNHTLRYTYRDDGWETSYTNLSLGHPDHSIADGDDWVHILFDTDRYKSTKPGSTMPLFWKDKVRGEGVHLPFMRNGADLEYVQFVLIRNPQEAALAGMLPMSDVEGLEFYA